MGFTTPTHILVLAIVIAILLVYISYYYRYPRDVSILQTSLAQFNENLLLEKQPIVIADRLSSIEQLRDAWFGYNIVRTVEYDEDGHKSTWYRNRFKFLVVQPTKDCEILLYPAGKKMVVGEDADGMGSQGKEPDPNETLLAIRATANQVIIIPIHWRVFISCPDPINVFGVHDLLSFMLP